jgi:hypothetical protein
MTGNNPLRLYEILENYNFLVELFPFREQSATAYLAARGGVMIVGMLLSAILGGLAGALLSALGGHGVGYVLLSYHATGTLSFLLFLTVTILYRRVR